MLLIWMRPIAFVWATRWSGKFETSKRKTIQNVCHPDTFKGLSNPKMIKAAARTRKRFIFIIGQVRRGAELKYKSSSCLAVIYLEFHKSSGLTRDPELFDVWHSVCLPGSISADSEWAQATAHTRRRMIMVTGQVRVSGELEYKSSFLFISDIVESSSFPALTGD